ncbi:TIGR04283 family arsenosugar biosynthesis glycosyltransferase [Thiovibrio sp. JS02]
MLTDRKTCDISVIIPTLNEEGTIARTLAQLAGRPGLEVLVVDGGSADRTVALAGKAGARVLSAPAGRGVQLNAGAAAASGRILLFLHADTSLPENFPELVSSGLARPGVAAGAFRFAVPGAGWRFRLLERLTNWRAGCLQLPYGDQALFLSAELFRTVGGYKEIPLLEDIDLVRRLRGLGKLILLPAAAVTSARRWQRLGLLRATLINQTILLGYLAGASPWRLARWYGKNR